MFELGILYSYIKRSLSSTVPKPLTNLETGNLFILQRIGNRDFDRIIYPFFWECDCIRSFGKQCILCEFKLDKAFIVKPQTQIATSQFGQLLRNCVVNCI